MAERLLYGLAGACLGAMISGSTMWFWLDEIIVPIVAACAVVAGLAAALGGHWVIDLLKEVWWWS